MLVLPCTNRIKTQKSQGLKYLHIAYKLGFKINYSIISKQMQGSYCLVLKNLMMEEQFTSFPSKDQILSLSEICHNYLTIKYLT